MTDISFRESGAGAPVVLLHGLFGSGSNLGALSRALRTEFHVYSLDLPGHGGSPPCAPFDLPGMAAALAGWLDEQGLEQASFVGHSLGGKVAMELALASPERVTKLAVADIAPVDYPPGHDAVFAAIFAVAAAQCRSREEAAALLSRYVAEAGVVQFLLSDLRRDAAGLLRFRFDPDLLLASYDDLRRSPQPGRQYAGPVQFIKGENSSYLQPQQREAIEAFFPAATLRVMSGTGHWLHVEKPELFNSLVRRFLVSQAT